MSNNRLMLNSEQYILAIGSSIEQNHMEQEEWHTVFGNDRRVLECWNGSYLMHILLENIWVKPGVLKITLTKNSIVLFVPLTHNAGV